MKTNDAPRILTSLVALGLTAIFAVPPTQAAAAVNVVRAPYLDGRTIHDGPRTVTVDWGPEPPASDAGFRGLGRTSDGRLAVTSSEYVGDPEDDNICESTSLWFIDAQGKAQTATQHTTCLFDDDGWVIGLSDTGDTFYESYSDMWGGQVTVTVRQLDGRRVGSRSFSISHEVLDLDGNQVVMGSLGGWEDSPALYVWTIGQGVRRVVTGTVNGADVRGRVQWRRAKSGYWTARDLTDPKAVLWKLRFRPVSVSPDGKRVLGLRTDLEGHSTGAVEVRRVRTGTLVRSLRPATPWRPAQIGWDGNGAVFGPRDSADGSWLVRCPLDAGCTRAQAISGSAALRVFSPQLQ